MVILSREMTEQMARTKRLGDDVLGEAITGVTETPGRIVYIFYDRILHIAFSHNASTLRGLGHVMAHEIGHVLLGVNSHSDEGLMRATWDPRESRRQTLTPDQVLLIRHRWAAMVSTVRSKE